MGGEVSEPKVPPIETSPPQSSDSQAGGDKDLLFIA